MKLETTPSCGLLGLVFRRKGKTVRKFAYELAFKSFKTIFSDRNSVFRIGK
jgi:hypothetical protein